MQPTSIRSPFLATLFFVSVLAATSTSAFGETIVLDCDRNQAANICPSVWTINSDVGTVMRHWCNDPDSVAQGTVTITPNEITFDDSLTGSYYDINRISGRMTIIAESYDGITKKKYDAGETMCHQR